MLFSRTKLEILEKKRLAPYAILSSYTKGREFPEPEDETRTCFQRDRDRIIHSKAFRRLAGKTQVFVANFGDHYRDRLSHTLEMAQISRDISRSLGLNEDLAEAIALAHDLGHTPFGHAGEETLNRIMKKFGLHFEHNEQSKRIVEVLEDRYPNFPGLNLTWEVREGLAKHQTHYDQRGQKISGKSLEAQVVDLADEIAYHNHDLDDGLRSRLFTLKDLQKLSLWKRAGNSIFRFMIQDVCQESSQRISRWKIRTPKAAMKKSKNAISFSPRVERDVKALRKFLWDRMYRSPKVMKHSKKGQKVIEFLFWNLYRHPELLPKKLRAKIDIVDSREVMVKDYVAGMTDDFALNLFYEMSKM